MVNAVTIACVEITRNRYGDSRQPKRSYHRVCENNQAGEKLNRSYYFRKSSLTGEKLSISLTSGVTVRTV